MKHQFTKVFLLLAAAVVGMGSFSSCKDSVEDVLVEVQEKYDDTELRARITKLEEYTQKLEQAQKDCQTNCSTARALLESKIEEYKVLLEKALADHEKTDEAAHAALQAQINDLAKQITSLTTSIAALDARDTELQNQINSNKTLITNLETAVETLGTAVGTNTAEIEKLKDAQAALEAALEAAVAQATAEIQNVVALLQQDLSSLREAIKQELNNISNKHDEDIERLEGAITLLDTNIVDLTNVINNLQIDLEAAEQRIAALENYTAGLDMAIIDLTNTVNNQTIEIEYLQNYTAGLDVAITDLTNVVSNQGAEIEYLQDYTAGLDMAIVDLTNSVNNQAIEIEALKEKLAEKIAEYDAAITLLDTAIVDLTNTVNQGLDNLEGAVEQLEGAITLLDTAIIDLTNVVEQHTAAIEALQQGLDTITGRVGVLEDRINSLITSINVNAITNPVYGLINLPVGVQTNILMAPWGEATNAYDYTFPSISTAAEYNGEGVLTEEDLKVLGNYGTFIVGEGQKLYNGTEKGIHVGRIYTTINPANVDFTGGKLSLVNSRDVESGIELSSVKKSDKLLLFGAGRANNGFYEVDAYVPESKIGDLRITIDNELKETAREFLKDKKNRNNFIQLLYQVMRQFNTKLVAYGLRAAWTDASGVENAIYSDYDIAAAVYRPLSYKFMAGEDTKGLKLPVITPLSDFEFDMDKIDFDFHVNVHEVELDFHLDSIKIDNYGEIKVTIGNIPSEFKANPDGTVTITGYKSETVTLGEAELKDFINAIEDSMNASITGWNQEIQNQFKQSMKDLVDQINGQVDDAMESISGKVNDLLADLEAEITGKVDGYMDRLNNYIERYNNAVNAINDRLENANHYLQVMALYKTSSGNFSQISNSKKYPSTFHLSGGNAISMFLSSYTAEILVPSYKKFVAVTNVWDEADNSAQGGDAVCKKLLDEANECALMNTPVDGCTVRVPLKLSKAGYTYEIVYSSLDYFGVTSSRKFYVKVLQ